MDSKSKDFSIEDARRMAATPAGQQLLSILQKQGDTNALKNAAMKASSGDYSQLQQALTPLLASEEVKALLKQLGG